MRVKYDSLLYSFGQNSYFISLELSEDNKLSSKNSWRSLKRLHRDHWHDTTSMCKVLSPQKVLHNVWSFTFYVTHTLPRFMFYHNQKPKARHLSDEGGILLMPK